MSSIPRIIDANANRAREALRLLEDYARFGLNDGPLSADLKSLRHTLAAALQALHADSAILHRDTPHDVGTTNKTPSEFKRTGIADLVTAAGKRLSEALRVLEEAGKTIDPAAAAQIEKLRYRGYALEQTLTRAAQQTNRFPPTGLYVLITEKLCHHPWQQTLDMVLAGGATCVQLREKDLPDSELLARARHLVAHCRAHNALAIINDHPDIALLAGAHGLHVGQTDLPCSEIRRLVGPDLLIGVSTENPTQAQQAQRDGASYIGVGPMFPTTTKDKPRIATPAYAVQALTTVTIPCVAIGGITPQNLPQVTATGIRWIATCSAIISDPNPTQRTQQFAQALALTPPTIENRKSKIENPSP